jgi:16S rRNA (cytosine967-C5)-methyltransferase
VTRPGARAGRTTPRDPRRIAFDVLRAVDERGAYANLALPALLRDRGVTGRDAALATDLAYGTLRRLGTYDAVLVVCVDRPLRRLTGAVHDVLRLGAHQLLTMRTPPHAAVATSVDLARTVAGVRAGGFVNAVLRRVAARDADAWLAEVAPPADRDPTGHLAVRSAHPRWVVTALGEALAAAGTPDELPALLAADNEAPAVTLVARPGRSVVAELLASGAAPGRWSPWAATIAGGDPGAVAAVRDGRAGVQDEGSQLVALALPAAPVAGAGRPGGERWLDLCAGPGGKAALLAGLAAAASARLVAVDVREHRARLVAATLAEGPGRSGVVVADGRAGPWPEAAFDRVLVDAPCTGLGALRRRPEARWRRSPDDVTRLRPLQEALLAAGIRAVRPGGVVAYVTCSPHLAETREVVAGLLAVRSDVEQLDARLLLPGVPDLGPGPHAQLWPHRHGTDAMFLAVLRRRGR